MVAESGASQAKRLFISSASLPEERNPLGRSRPLSLAVVELIDDRRLIGYPIALASRDEEAAAMQLPVDFEARIVEPSPREGIDLLLLDADERQLRVPLRSIRRLYHPNRLDPIDRARLLLLRVWEEFGARWRQSAPQTAAEPEGHPPVMSDD
ncbi:hypothetical protein [Wenzhouxiangella marina]|uniref:Uncharacterized protein n=1 Tax=Wenzhouxiangella marina TaxID=1579979 RepID=A0A0K0XXJ9_9GAMM|nr:hypothetical protein [Wenzhouxiangella marina]AKS42400.1 hypothetical protein WM2015_2035 [Wenzhouxiangella marina]MBB6085826.1 hypothetical protein [Wenzhouxiangella marina]